MDFIIATKDAKQAKRIQKFNEKFNEVLTRILERKNHYTADDMANALEAAAKYSKATFKDLKLIERAMKSQTDILVKGKF